MSGADVTAMSMGKSAAKSSTFLHIARDGRWRKYLRWKSKTEQDILLSGDQFAVISGLVLQDTIAAARKEAGEPLDAKDFVLRKGVRYVFTLDCEVAPRYFWMLASIAGPLAAVGDCSFAPLMSPSDEKEREQPLFHFRPYENMKLSEMPSEAVYLFLLQ